MYLREFVAWFRQAWCGVDPPRPVRHVKKVVLVENEQKGTEGEIAGRLDQGT